MIDDERIIELFFKRLEQGIRELDIKYGKVCRKLPYHIIGSSHYTIALEEIEACIANPNTVKAEIEARELARIIESFLDTLTTENPARQKICTLISDPFFTSRHPKRDRHTAQNAYRIS